MSEIVTSLLKATAGFLVDKARDRAAEKLKDGDVTDNKIRELIQREINDIKSKLDARSRKDLLTALDAFQVGVRYLHQALQTRSAKILLLEGKERFRLAREDATRAFNNEALDTLHRITAIQYRVMAAMLESVAKSLAVTEDLSSMSRENALQSAGPEFKQSLQQLHALPDVKKNFKVELRNGLFNIRRRFGQGERREIICAVCQVNRFIYDAQEFDFDHYDWPAIKIGEKTINLLYSGEVAEVLDKAGMRHSYLRNEWSFRHNGEEGLPSRIATNTHGEFLVVDCYKTIQLFDSSGEFSYKIHPQVQDTVGIGYLADVATDVNNNTYILICLSESETYSVSSDRYEVQVFTKTKMCNTFPVRSRSSRLTVSHDRVYLGCGDAIAVYDLDGTRVGTFGIGTLSAIKDIAAGSDGQIFVLNHKLGNETITYVFTEDGHQQNSFRVDSEEDDYSALASYPSGEHIVFSGFERKSGILKVAMYRKDGALNRSVTLGGRLSKDGEWSVHGVTVYGIAVTNDGSVAISFGDQEDQRKVIVRPMKLC